MSGPVQQAIVESIESSRWFCLKSQPKHEHIAAAHLRKMPGVEVFSPRLRFQRATSRGPRWFEEATFPGYLFARFSFLLRHKEVRYAMGVSSILRFGERYAALDDAVIDSLRQQMDDRHVTIVKDEVREGDTVKVAEGAFMGLEAIVTQLLSGRDRVRLLLNFLGRDTSLEVAKSSILPARRHPLAA